MSESSSHEFRSHLYMDYTGNLQKGYFYSFNICIGDSAVIVDGIDTEEEVIVSPRNPPFDKLYEQSREEYMSVESIYIDVKNLKQCSLDPSHVTQQSIRSAAYAVKQNGRTADFIEDTIGDNQSFFVSNEFAEKLKSSELTGWNLTPATYVAPENYSDHFTHDNYDSQMGIPRNCEYELFVLNFTGKPIIKAIQIRNALNACPFCNWGPIICPQCGYFSYDCKQCNKRVLFQGRKEKYRGLKIDGLLSESDYTGQVLEANRYDGSDFIYPNFISRRAVNWLLEQKAAPFYACPVFLDVSSDVAWEK